jgi:putative component of toxin-antitoxin plasmid stabilization module
MPWKLLQVGTVFDDFYAGCDDNLREKIDARLAQLMMKGNMAKEPVSKPLGDGLFELRADSADHHARFPFCFLPGQRIVVIDAQYKDQRTLPQAVINNAKNMVRLLKAGEIGSSDVKTKLH